MNINQTITKSENLHQIINKVKLANLLAIKKIKEPKDGEMRVLAAIVAIYIKVIDKPKLSEKTLKAGEGVNKEFFNAFLAKPVPLFKKIQTSLKQYKNDEIEPANVYFAKRIIKPLKLDKFANVNTIQGHINNLLNFVQDFTKFYENNKNFKLSQFQSFSFLQVYVDEKLVVLDSSILNSSFKKNYNIKGSVNSYRQSASNLFKKKQEPYDFDMQRRSTKLLSQDFKIPGLETTINDDYKETEKVDEDSDIYSNKELETPLINAGTMKDLKFFKPSSENKISEKFFDPKESHSSEKKSFKYDLESPDGKEHLLQPRFQQLQTPSMNDYSDSNKIMNTRLASDRLSKRNFSVQTDFFGNNIINNPLKNVDSEMNSIQTKNTFIVGRDDPFKRLKQTKFNEMNNYAISSKRESESDLSDDLKNKNANLDLINDANKLINKHVRTSQSLTLHIKELNKEIEKKGLHSSDHLIEESRRNNVIDVTADQDTDEHNIYNPTVNFDTFSNNGSKKQIYHVEGEDKAMEEDYSEFAFGGVEKQFETFSKAGSKVNIETDGIKEEDIGKSNKQVYFELKSKRIDTVDSSAFNEENQSDLAKTKENKSEFEIEELEDEKMKTAVGVEENEQADQINQSKSEESNTNTDSKIRELSSIKFNTLEENKQSSKEEASEHSLSDKEEEKISDKSETEEGTPSYPSTDQEPSQRTSYKRYETTDLIDSLANKHITQLEDEEFNKDQVPITDLLKKLAVQHNKEIQSVKDSYYSSKYDTKKAMDSVASRHIKELYDLYQVQSYNSQPLYNSIAHKYLKELYSDEKIEQSQINQLIQSALSQQKMEIIPTESDQIEINDITKMSKDQKLDFIYSLKDFNQTLVNKDSKDTVEQNQKDLDVIEPIISKTSLNKNRTSINKISQKDLNSSQKSINGKIKNILNSHTNYMDKNLSDVYIDIYEDIREIYLNKNENETRRDTIRKMPTKSDMQMEIDLIDMNSIKGKTNQQHQRASSDFLDINLVEINTDRQTKTEAESERISVKCIEPENKAMNNIHSVYPSDVIISNQNSQREEKPSQLVFRQSTISSDENKDDELIEFNLDSTVKLGNDSIEKPVEEELQEKNRREDFIRIRNDLFPESQPQRLKTKPEEIKGEANFMPFWNKEATGSNPFSNSQDGNIFKVSKEERDFNNLDNTKTFGISASLKFNYSLTNEQERALLVTPKPLEYSNPKNTSFGNTENLHSSKRYQNIFKEDSDEEEVIPRPVMKKIKAKKKNFDKLFKNKKKRSKTAQNTKAKKKGNKDENKPNNTNKRTRKARTVSITTKNKEKSKPKIIPGKYYNYMKKKTSYFDKEKDDILKEKRNIVDKKIRINKLKWRLERDQKEDKDKKNRERDLDEFKYNKAFRDRMNKYFIEKEREDNLFIRTMKDEIKDDLEYTKKLAEEEEITKRKHELLIELNEIRERMRRVGKAADIPRLNFNKDLTVSEINQQVIFGRKKLEFELNKFKLKVTNRKLDNELEFYEKFFV